MPTDWNRSTGPRVGVLGSPVIKKQAVETAVLSGFRLLSPPEGLS